jgi:hypothetical protein
MGRNLLSQSWSRIEVLRYVSSRAAGIVNRRQDS